MTGRERTLDIRTGITETACPTVQTDPGPVVGADVVAELIVPGVARQRTAATVVPGVADETVSDSRRPSTVLRHRRR